MKGLDQYGPALFSFLAMKGEISKAHKTFRFPYAIYHRKTATPKTGDIDSLYVINPVSSIYINKLSCFYLFYFFFFVKSFFKEHVAPSPW